MSGEFVPSLPEASGYPTPGDDLRKHDVSDPEPKDGSDSILPGQSAPQPKETSCYPPAEIAGLHEHEAKHSGPGEDIAAGVADSDPTLPKSCKPMVMGDHWQTGPRAEDGHTGMASETGPPLNGSAKSISTTPPRSSDGLHGINLPLRPKPGPIDTGSTAKSAKGNHNNNNMRSAPVSPPTPAPSPSPREHALPDWSTAGEDEEAFTRDIRSHFSSATDEHKKRVLAELLNMCDTRQLTFAHDFICPKLKKDPFMVLPDELCIKILSHVDHPKTLGRSAQVSRRWYHIVSDDLAWKALCERHMYRMNHSDPTDGPSVPPPPIKCRAPRMPGSWVISTPSRFPARPTFATWREAFKRRFMVETAWKSKGEKRECTFMADQGIVTSLHLTNKYIAVGLENARVNVFDTKGDLYKILAGHHMGVWAIVLWGDILVSGGCDRDLRVWDLNSGPFRATAISKHTLGGHSSTVRCLKMSDAKTAISGSRDTTLRVWDIERGVCTRVLVGHQASVRCMDVHGDIVVSGSYDTTARIWSISEGKCLQVLSGHFSQIYTISFDGARVATGSLDTSVRLWSLSGQCLSVLQGHTSLVGQLQMRGDTLVTGGSDGSVRVWSLESLGPIHRLAAHDNSVTSLQFDDKRIVSGGSDGRCKIWDLETGTLVRELGQPAESVWRVVFNEEKAVVLLTRRGSTIMEIWDFAPVETIPDWVQYVTDASPESSEDGRSDVDEYEGHQIIVDNQIVVLNDGTATQSEPAVSPAETLQRRFPGQGFSDDEAD